MAASLLDVLRQEMNAVNQQFFHILALREWDDQDTAKRITQVDNIDFPNAMRIIDHLVGSGARVDLAPARFSPGQNPGAVLIAEREIERRLSRAIDAADAAGDREALLLDTAREPRQAYLGWLEQAIEETVAAESEPPPDAAETAATVAQLVTLTELSMVHAFIHWHGGERDAADAAWATSGASMMHLTRLVRAFAKLPGVPFPDECPPPDIRQDTAEALRAEQGLASLCAGEARAASCRCAEQSVAGLCRHIADTCAEFASWDMSAPHPAAATNPPSFRSFEATLEKFVH